MFTVADYRAIISGERRGVWAAAWRGGLTLLEPLYRLGIDWRNDRYERNRAPIYRVAAPVISVGNLTTGGTGKTPCVAWIASWLRQQQRRVTLISRGYGAPSGTPNDEALELAALLPDVRHIQNANRVAAARQIAAELPGEVILLDDAFQHRRLHRDLDIVLIDVLEPFGFEHLLPRGLLREPLSSLRRAHVIGLSRTDLATSAQRAAITSRVRAEAPDALLVEMAHRPRALLSSTGETTCLSALQGRRIAAFCGLGNPRGFRETLARCGVELADFREFPDHFAYRESDVRQLTEWVSRLDVDLVVCTMKDFVKLRLPALGSCPLRALTIGVEFLSGQRAFESRLSTIIAT